MSEQKLNILGKSDMEITWPCGHAGKFSDSECQTCLSVKLQGCKEGAIEQDEKKVVIQGLSNNESLVQRINQRLKPYSNVVKTSITKCEGELALSVRDLIKHTTVNIKASEQLLKDIKEGLDTFPSSILEQLNTMKSISLYKLCANKEYRESWYDNSKKKLKLGFKYSVSRTRNKILAFLGVGGAGVSVGTFAFAVWSWCH